MAGACRNILSPTKQCLLSRNLRIISLDNPFNLPIFNIPGEGTCNNVIFLDYVPNKQQKLKVRCSMEYMTINTRYCLYDCPIGLALGPESSRGYGLNP